jgi:uncharacterized protein (TIGR04222 family)
MIPSGDTWGIGGPTFLLAYLVLAVAVTAAVVRARRTLADVPVARPVDRIDARPYDVAHLNAGADLALCAALAAMHRRGTITVPRRGTVVAAGRPEPRTDELERAVHHVAATPVPRTQLARTGAVASALRRVESRLTDAGLLLAPDRRRAIRALAGWTFVLAALGVVRIVADLGNGRPVGLLVVAVLGVVAIGLVQAASVPRRTRAGDALLRRLADEHHVLAPSMRPDWQVYGPAGAALSVGVFGLGALWAADPAFAGELALQRATAGSSGGGSSGDGGSSGSDGGSGSGNGCGGGGGCGGCGGG